MGYREDWNAKKPDLEEMSIRENEMWNESGEAMLEALFAAARESPTGTFTIYSKAIDVYGTMSK